MTGLKDQCFGVEVEMTGITREQAAQALADYFGTVPRYKGGAYEAWVVKDTENKEWKLMSDGSIHAERKTLHGYEQTNNRQYKVEMVSPKLAYAELPKFQECVRQVRRAGAKVNESCGLHIHVDAANHNRQSLKNLLSIMYSKEDILFKALQVNEARAARWCQKVREPMLLQARTLSAEETKDLTQLESIWYEGEVSAGEHYNWTRYYALNLHSVFYRGTGRKMVMKCPYCGYQESKVVDSRHSEDGLSIRRRRECLSCQKRFTTYETVECLPIVVIKRGGIRQAFDRNKILNGMLRACEKRPVPMQLLENAADEIEQSIQNSLDREVSTEKIGELVMEKLKPMDEVAYVRFASVYRQFKDIDSFKRELDKILEER